MANILCSLVTKKITGVGRKPRNKVTMYLKIKGIVTKMERKGIILKARSTVGKEEGQNRAKQKQKAATNIYRINKRCLFSK